LSSLLPPSHPISYHSSSLEREMSLPPEVGIEEEEEEEEVALSQQLQELIEAKQAEKIE